MVTGCLSPRRPHATRLSLFFITLTKRTDLQAKARVIKGLGTMKSRFSRKRSLHSEKGSGAIILYAVGASFALTIIVWVYDWIQDVKAKRMGHYTVEQNAEALEYTGERYYTITY